jgi:DNA replication initiation complex subunit (GINS family)
MNYSELSGVLMEEKRNPQLQNLSPLFFDDVESLLVEYQKRIKENFDVDSERSFRNLKKKFEELQMVRIKKIFLQVLSDFQLSKISFEGMSDKERELYLFLSDHLKNFLNKRSEASVLKLKLLAHIPKFMGLSGKEYGPFEKDSFAEMDLRDADILLSRNVAEKTA